METCVLIPPEFSLAVTTLSSNTEAEITVWTTTDIAQGSLFYPFQGTIRLDKLDTFKYLEDDDVRYRFGLYDEISYTYGKRVRHCNWVRFLRVSNTYDLNVNIVCTKVKGEPIYEVVKPITMHQELVVFYLAERPEELFFMRMRSSLYRQTMDSILEDSPLDLSMSLLHRATLPVSPISSSEDEHKSISSESSGSMLSFNEISSDHLIMSGDPTTTVIKETMTTTTTSTTKINNNNNNINSINNKYQTPQRSTRVGRGERSLLPCDVCGKAFDRPSLLKRHMRTHTGEKPHVCMVCGKGFSTSSSLNTHRRIHSGEKPHECQVCGKRFTASSNLYYHRMTHIKEKPHKCSLCAKSFPTPGDLKSHMYVHSGSWPFKCHICFRGFSKQTNLKNHLFLHTGDKPHGCELCNKKFALACNLRAHMKTHEGDPQDECVRCGKVFVTSANTVQHGLCASCGSDSNDLTDSSAEHNNNNNNNHNNNNKTGFRSNGSGGDDEEETTRTSTATTTEDEEESSNGATEYSDK